MWGFIVGLKMAVPGITENTRKQGVSVAATGFYIPTGKTVNFAKEGIWSQHKKSPPQEGH